MDSLIEERDSSRLQRKEACGNLLHAAAELACSEILSKLIEENDASRLPRKEACENLLHAAAELACSEMSNATTVDLPDCTRATKALIMSEQR